MSREGKSLRVTLLITIMMLVCMFAYVPQEAEASQLTIVTTSINPASQNVNVAPGSTGAILFSGECTAEPYGPAPIVVSLQAVMEGGGTAAVSPSSFTLSNQQTSQPLSISVVVPILISRQSMIKVRLTGTYQQGMSAGSVGPSEAQVIILQYYKFIVFSENPYQEVSPGDSLVFSLRIENLGNGQDTLVTKVLNQDDLVDDAWTLTPIPILTIDEKMEKKITYTIQTPQKWTIWQNKIHMIELQMVSEDSGGAVKQDYPLFVRAKGVYIPGFEPIFTIMILVGMAFIMQHKRKIREP
jgi:hypothetical protein